VLARSQGRPLASQREGALLDQFGAPIPPATIAALREEISPPGAMHARPPFSGHLAFGMEPRRLGTILRGADSGNSFDWMILAEEIEELFPHYTAVLSKRRRQVAQLPVTVEAADHAARKGGGKRGGGAAGGGKSDYEKHADFVRQWIADGVLGRAMFDITDAIGKGYSVSEIIWETEPGSFRPAELVYRTPRFFELSWVDGATVWLRTENGFEDLVPHKFLLHTHRSKSGLVVRSGLTRQVAFLWLYAAYNLKDWALFCQGYGMPIRVGRYGPEASETDKRVLWRAVSSIAGDVAAIIPKSMEMEFVKDNERSAGSMLYEKRGDWLNREVSKLVLGSTAGTEAISGGHAVGREHYQVEQDVERFDAGLLSISITRQIVQAMISFTFGPQDAYPVLRIGRPEEVPLKDVITAIADLGGMGLKVKASEIRDRLQLTEPEDDDETIGGAPPPAPPKPDIPRPAVVPTQDAPDAQSILAPSAALPAARWLGNLIARHSEAPPELVEQLTERLGADAAGALAGLTETVRHTFEAAHDMRDLAHRLGRLNLPPEEFAEAMARGLALAQLVGQASLVEELRGRR
jgi:phage gp29-like protein